METADLVSRQPLPPYPVDDEATDEVLGFERLMRRHAAAEDPEVTIEEEIEREGIEDKDPFEAFGEMDERELTDPGLEEEADLPILDVEALELLPESPKPKKG